MNALTWQTVGDFLKAMGGLVAVLSFPIAVRTYYRSSKTRRAEWLVSLYEKFYESDRYSRIRGVLDYRFEPEYSELAQAVAAGAYSPLADDLYRYLNFFELLAGLRKLGQISEAEVLQLFDYDLRVIRRSEFIVRALQPEGFEELAVLLSRVALLRP